MRKAGEIDHRQHGQQHGHLHRQCLHGCWGLPGLHLPSVGSEDRSHLSSILAERCSGVRLGAVLVCVRSPHEHTHWLPSTLTTPHSSSETTPLPPFPAAVSGARLLCSFAPPAP